MSFKNLSSSATAPDKPAADDMAKTAPVTEPSTTQPDKGPPEVAPAPKS